MTKVFVDTNYIIDFVKKKSLLLDELGRKRGKGEIDIVTNAIVAAEFFTDQQTKKEDFYKQMIELFGMFQILSITREIGIMAGSYLRDGVVLDLPDALIAATCVKEDCLLATRNIKHFSHVPGLKFYPATK